jgi:hypothetical protein
MKDAMNKDGSVIASERQRTQRPRKRGATHCSICNRRIWFDPIHVMEPEGVPEPRLSWVLCKHCYEVLLVQMRCSPVRSPLRLRIAIGLVASERWPEAYSTRIREYIIDRRWVVFIAVGCIAAVIIHLIIIVMIAGLH